MIYPNLNVTKMDPPIEFCAEVLIYARILKFEKYRKKRATQYQSIFTSQALSP